MTNQTLQMPALVQVCGRDDIQAAYDYSPFGVPRYDLAALPDRLWLGLDLAERPPSTHPKVPGEDLEPVSSPIHYLIDGDDCSIPAGWTGATRQSLARLESLWLICEDRYALLNVEAIEPLAHQKSLVDHVLAQPRLSRALIADEVGLGKTIECGLIIRGLRNSQPSKTLQVLYLTEARLVANVAEEMGKLGLRPRAWSSHCQEARLTPGDSDAFVIASINLAVANEKRRRVVAKSGPWDMLVVDEAHHLSDWSPDGNDPRRRMRLVRTLVKERLNPNGRLLLMTGTPHQGHEHRLKNLLRLLSANRDDEQEARGRVIYRTKDDIKDWEGNPLFPSRTVNEPIKVTVAAAYQEWQQQIKILFSSSEQTRASGWRLQQASCYAASSPQAGLAYLSRYAIRQGLSSTRFAALHQAIEALRPYRGGAKDEFIDRLEERLVHLGPSEQPDEDTPEAASPPLDDRSMQLLADALIAGTHLVRDDALAAKLGHVRDILDTNSEEKLVIFAQPVETVWALKGRLERILGAKEVSIIVGDQSEDERRRQIERFCRTPDGARVLVSSRAGGEGINLQVCRRLVHFDVPWNPMEMEQRVGRIHRYGSEKRIIIDTLVLADSREERVISRCRARLARIVGDMESSPERQEHLFARIMSGVPSEQWAKLMEGEGWTSEDDSTLNSLVEEGRENWRRVDEELRIRSSTVRAVERGEVGDHDLEDFIVGRLNARRLAGWTSSRLETCADGATQSVPVQVGVLELADNTYGYVGSSNGCGRVCSSDGRSARRLGLNDPYVLSGIRSFVGFSTSSRRQPARSPTGAGVVKIQAGALNTCLKQAALPSSLGAGVLLLAYVVRYLNERESNVPETGAEIHFYVSPSSSIDPVRLSSGGAAAFMRVLRSASPRREPRQRFAADWEAVDCSIVERLRASTTRHAEGVAAAVFPIAALEVVPS